MLQKATTNFLKALSCKKISSSFRAILISSLSLILVACGSKGEMPTIDVVYEKDKIPPTLTEFTVTNSCNFTPSIALNDNILVRVVGSESLRKPVVTILGEAVEMSGKARNWTGEFSLTQGPVRETNEVVTANVIDFIKNENSLTVVEAASRFREDLGLSDPDLMVLVEALESEFNVNLPDPSSQDEKGEINTVQQVVNSIQSMVLEIPVTVSYSDISGEEGVHTELVGTKVLKFCEVNCQCFPEDISGIWENRYKAGSMGVGPSEGSIASWSISDFDLTKRHCVFDDTYTFGVKDPDIDDTGSFNQFMGNLTWLDVGMNPEGREECAPALSPWDGLSNEYTYIWDPENKELTLKGLGAHIGIPRIQNGSNAASDGASGKITYNVATASSCLLFLDILGADSEWWHFELEKIKDSAGEPMTVAKCDAAAGSSGGASADLTLDTDGDGVADFYDIFPDDSTRTIDTDMDGLANEFDDDDDGDGFLDGEDCAPLDKDVTVCEGDGSSTTDNGVDLTNSQLVSVVIEDQFGGALITEAATDSDVDTYSVPSGSETEVWAGFTLVPDFPDGDPTPLPISFGTGGQIKFNASVVGDSDTSVRFRFEKEAVLGQDLTLPIPSYTTPSKNISGETSTEYTIVIPPLGSRVFNSMIFYIDDNDTAISITDIVISETAAAAGSEVGPFVYEYSFGGSSITADGTYTVPSSAQDTGGFAHNANVGINLNPLHFGAGGAIRFIGSVNGGGTVKVRFDLQGGSHPNIFPQYITESVNVTGVTPRHYTIPIPEQYDLGYKNVVLWLDTYDKEVVLNEIMISVTEQGARKVAVEGPADFTDGAFEGASYNASNDTYTFPENGTSGVTAYAGFANDNTDLFPFLFDTGGCVTFNASASEGEDVRVRFKFENYPYPMNEPEIFTEYQTISGAEQQYSLDVPASANQDDTYRSFLMFIHPDDRGLDVGVNNVVATNSGSCPTNL